MGEEVVSRNQKNKKKIEYHVTIQEGRNKNGLCLRERRGTKGKTKGAYLERGKKRGEKGGERREEKKKETRDKRRKRDKRKRRKRGKRKRKMERERKAGERKGERKVDKVSDYMHVSVVFYLQVFL